MTNVLKRLVNEALVGASKVELERLTSKLDYVGKLKLLTVIELLLNELQHHQILTQKPIPASREKIKDRPVIAVKIQTKATAPENRSLDELWPPSESSPAPIPVTQGIVDDAISVDPVQGYPTEPVNSTDDKTVEPFETPHVPWPEVFQIKTTGHQPVVRLTKGWTSTMVKGRQY